jgi:hypothetical protein
VDNNLTQAEIGELAKLFGEENTARELLAECGLPAHVLDALRWPDADGFWALLAGQLAAGAMYAGRERLLDAAHTRYPANRLFALGAETPAVGRDMYQATHGGHMVVVQGDVRIRQSASDAKPLARKQTKVFFLGASPFDIELARLRADREFKAIREVAQRGRLSVVNRTAATVDDIADVLDELPDVLHVSCHSKEGRLVLEDSAGDPHLVPVESLARRMRVYRDHGGFRLAGLVLAVCDSSDFAGQFTDVADTVVAWRGDLDDECAILFARALYRAMSRESPRLLRDAARMAAVEVAESDVNCGSLIDQLTVLPV